MVMLWVVSPVDQSRFPEGAVMLVFRFKAQMPSGRIQIILSRGPSKKAIPFDELTVPTGGGLPHTDTELKVEPPLPRSMASTVLVKGKAVEDPQEAM